MTRLKLNILFLMPLVLPSVPAVAAELQSPPDSLNHEANESFILLPNVAGSNNTNTGLTSKTSPFPAFYLLDTTLSTLVIDEALSIQVELHKVDFFISNKKDTASRMPKSEIVALPRQKSVTIPSAIPEKKIIL